MKIKFLIFLLSFILLFPFKARAQSHQNDKEIIQRITERPEYAQYLFKKESELTKFSRSQFRQGLNKILNFIREIFTDTFDENSRSIMNTNWLNNILNLSIWKTVLFFMVLIIGFLLYKLLKRIKIKMKPKIDKINLPYSWQNFSRMPDLWQDLIREILNYYLSSINIILRQEMSLRYCLVLLENNQRSDSFICELVEFLEKWHYSTWQPDEKLIKSWFKSIHKKSEQFKKIKLNINNETVI